MKTYSFIFALFISVFAYSQEIQEEENGEIEEEQVETVRDTLATAPIAQNEVSVGVFNLIAFGALDLAYERFLNENSSLAAEIFTQAFKDKDAADSYEKKVSFTGKYKYFFSPDYARGFYLHGFGMLSHGENETGNGRFVDGVYQEDYRNYTDLGLGLGAGGKFLFSHNFILDINAGLGKNLFHPNAPSIIGHFNVNIGYRF